MSRPNYDVIVVGAGPAGIFAALELTQAAPVRLLMLDKGPSLNKRRCPARETGRCMKCATCALVTGWGGSGAFSDGKLTLSSQVGGLLAAELFTPFGFGRRAGRLAAIAAAAIATPILLFVVPLVA